MSLRLFSRGHAIKPRRRQDENALLVTDDDLDLLRELADTREVAQPKSRDAEQLAAELALWIDEVRG